MCIRAYRQAIFITVVFKHCRFVNGLAPNIERPMATLWHARGHGASRDTDTNAASKIRVIFFVLR